MAAVLRRVRGRLGPEALLAASIAVVSVLGAVAAYRASIAEQEGGRLLRVAVLETVEQEQISSALEARVDNDMRTVPQYAEALNLAVALDTQASKATDTSLRQTLQQQAVGERALAHTMEHFFLVRDPDVSANADGTIKVTYDREAALQGLESHNTDLQALDPEATRQSGESEHQKSVLLTLLLVAFAFALLLLTVARFVPRAWRMRLIIPGGAITAGAAVAMLAVERWA